MSSSTDADLDIIREAAGMGTLTCLPIDNAYDFHQMFFPEEELYRWQIEALLQLSGYCDPYKPESRVEPTKEKPLLMTMCAANGSGKDMIVLSVWALWEICCHKQAHWIGTSSSFAQLDQQTWRHIRSRAETLQKLLGAREIEITKFKVIYKKSKSEITLFRTDESAKAEGWHPLVPGGRMSMVLNESKSLDQDLVTAFRRCHGYTHWLNISSAGDSFGYFYEKCVTAEHVWPAPIVLGKTYFRRITVHDCPHLRVEFERDLQDFAIESPYIQSSYLSNFIQSGSFFVVPPDRVLYAYPPKASLGMPKRVGIDFGLGGDATCISPWVGNYPLPEIEFNEAHEPTLTRMVVAALRDLDVEPGQVYADLGNFGQAIVPRIREEGLNINGVHNQSAARNKKAYANRGAETTMNFARLVTDKLLNLKDASPKLKRQMTQRKYFYKDGKLQLEPKAEFRARIGYSPNNLDAAILAHVGCGAHVLQAASADINSVAVDPNQHWRREYELIYGKLDNDRARSGAYRTSGVYGRREIGNPLQRLGR